MVKRHAPDLRKPAVSPSPAALLPAVAGWRTFSRAFVSILTLGLAVIGGEWIVHQLSYLIEFGSTFAKVMRETPHRYYMAPAGASLCLAVVALLILLGWLLLVTAREQSRLVTGIPQRLLRRMPAWPHGPSPSAVFGTAALLACCQTLLFFIQENFEFASINGVWPGLTVLAGPGHVAVLPLQAAVATLISLALWWVSLLVGHARSSLVLARLLAAFTASAGRRQRLSVYDCNSLNRPLLPGSISLRSPPAMSSTGTY